MVELLSGQVTFSGLGSGTDFTSMIEKLIEVEATHKKQLELWKQSWEIKNEALTELNNSIVSLQSTLKTMDTMDEFMAKTVASTDSTVVTATAEAEAEEGTHSIQVNQLATNSIWISGGGVSDTDASVNTSTQEFTYSYNDPSTASGARTVSVSIRANTSLATLRDTINADPNNPGVRASVISDGSSYYLQIRGLDLGSGANLTVMSSNTSFGSLGYFSESQENLSAEVKVNGWPIGSNSWVTSSSNTISSAIDGLSLNLRDTGTVQITVDTDTDGIKSNIQTFVDKVNEVRTLFTALTDVETDNDSAKGSIMTGNYAVQLVDSNITFAIAGIGQGFMRYGEYSSNSGDIYTALSQLGILTDADESSETTGLLLIDDDVLDEALASNATAVAELFAADFIGDQTVTSSEGNFSYYSHIDTITEPGIYDVSYSIDSSGNITGATVDGQDVLVNNTDHTLTVETGDAQGLIIKVNELVEGGPYTGIVRLKQGKAGELVDTLSDLSSENSGPLNIVKNNYEDIIANISDKIEYEETRLARMKTDMTQKYARLEALLGQYSQQQQSLASQIGQLGSTS